MTIERITIEDANGDPQDVAVDTFDTDNHAQIVKAGFGAEDAAPTLVSSSNPLPVVQTGALPAGTNAIGKLAANSGVDIGDVDVTSLPSIPAGNNNIGDVDIASIAAGDNNIGNVDVLTLPALPAGTNNIGDVDVLTLPALPAGSNNIGDVDVLTVPADPFGANADAAVAAGATGSIQAKLRRATQGLEDLKTLIVLAAGNNNIGDVDVATQPARARTTDTISAALATDVVMQGTTARTPVSIVISAASSGDNTLLAAQGSGNKIRILQLVLIAAGTVNVRLESAASGTAMSGVMSLVANTGFVLPFSPIGWGDTAGNALLNLELSQAIQVSGILTYAVVT